ncbi:unnamed protein product [Cuscuta campestris]|uniref:Integrase catalytic domain-containing protein n=1 Tax=Cuscuta campestris TaxID=132261 RepID=A0A484NA51_9ASTE|nr:unnamed protein product [Cuscuta campestris]
MAVTSFKTPVPQPSPFKPQLVRTMAPVNLAGALNAAGPSRPPQATNPQITPDGHCVSIESDDGEWDIPRAHKKKKGKNIRPATSRNSAFERLGDKEEGERKSAKQRLGQSVAHVSAFARLGEVREAEPARTWRSRSNRQEPARTRASRQEEEAESQPRLPVANRLTIPNDRVQQMEAKLERLEKKAGEKNDRDKPLAGSPFTTRVHLTPFPRKTLRNRATEWFNKLRPGNIDSFSDLASKFKAKFQENCTKRKKFTYLSTAGQRESENHTQFLTRWKEEVDKVEEMDDKTVLSLLLNGLRAGNYTRGSAGNPQPRTKRPTILRGSLLRLKLNSGQREKLSMVTSPSRCKSRRKKHRDLAGRGTTMTRSPGWSIRKNAKKCGKHLSFLQKTLPMIDSGELGKDYLQKAQEKSHQWVRPTAPGDDRDNDRRRNNRPRERQPAPEKEHIGMIFGGPEGGDSAAQRKNWVRSIYVGEVSAEPPRRKHTRREPIVFTDRDLPPTGEDHNDPLVITMDINGVDVARVLVDTGSSVNILYLETFQKLRLCRTQLEPLKTPLSGFTGDTVEAEGSIVLPVELGSGGVGEVKGDQRNARECYARAVKKMTKGVIVISQEITKGETREKLEPEAETVEIELHPGDSSRMVRMGANLPEDLKAQITRVLKEYVGIFAWSVADMPGIDRSVIYHLLAVREGSRPVRQKKRYLASDRREFVKKEVKDLLSVGHIWEVKYPDWNLITDNGPQSRNPRFTEYLEGFGIKHNRSSVAYPQRNGQVENANRTIVDGLKKRLGEAGNKWLEELPHIVWAFRVTPRRAHGETSFSLTYGCEARLPIEAEFPTFRESNYQPQQNEEDHLAELNLVEERRMAAEVKMSTYQQVVKKYHDNKVGPRYFQVGDEVLRRREASRPGDGGKLAKNWEGPYRVRAIIRPGTYRLETLDGVPVERTWNSHHLRKFYK